MFTIHDVKCKRKYDIQKDDTPVCHICNGSIIDGGIICNKCEGMGSSATINNYRRHQIQIKGNRDTVISALKSYATAVGAKYIDLDLLTKVPPTTGNNTGGGVTTVVNQTAYTDAMNMIAKAQSQLQSLSQTANPQQAILIAKAQGGVEALKTMIERKAPFNITEDIAQSPIVNNLWQLS